MSVFNRGWKLILVARRQHVSQYLSASGPERADEYEAELPYHLAVIEIETPGVCTVSI
jgi:hypothetical protein